MNLYLGMPLVELLDLLEDNNIEEKFRTYILNYCKQELQYCDAKISNEIELAMLNAWFNNSDKIEMPKYLGNKYSLTDIYSYNNHTGTVICEEYTSSDKSYYIRSVYKNSNGDVIKVTLSHKSKSLSELFNNSGTEDFLTDSNNDGFADSRSVIKLQDNSNAFSPMILSDINIDGKID